jgi:hypothetical protein
MTAPSTNAARKWTKSKLPVKPNRPSRKLAEVRLAMTKLKRENDQFRNENLRPIVFAAPVAVSMPVAA